MLNPFRRYPHLEQAVAGFYETYGASFSATRRSAWDIMQLVRDACRPGDVVIDVGAGNGRLSHVIPPDVTYVAIEPSSTLRDAAQEFVKDRPQTEIRVGAFPELPAKDAEADVAACLAVLHHIPGKTAQRHAIGELHRLLKEGGTLVLSVWNLRKRNVFTWKTWLAAWLRLPMVWRGEPGDAWIPWKADDEQVQRYVHAFTLQELHDLFDDRMWNVARCEAWDEKGPVTNIRDARNLVVVAKKSSPMRERARG